MSSADIPSRNRYAIESRETRVFPIRYAPSIAVNFLGLKTIAVCRQGPIDTLRGNQLSRYRCETAVARARTFFRIMGRTPAMRISTIANVQTMVAPVGKSINRER